MATPLGLDPTLALGIGAALIVLGLALAFWGRGIWRFIMAIIGAALGSILGFIIGFAIAGYLLGLGLSFVGAFIGSILFGKLVKIGLALVMGLLAAGIVFLALGAPTGTGLGDARMIAAIVALLIVFAISYYFIEELIGFITALIGGLLLGLGAWIILGTGTGLIAGGAGLAVFVIGAILQTMKTRRQKRVAAAVAAPPPSPAYQYPQAPPPPPPPPPPSG